MGHLDSGVGDMFAIGYSLLRKVRVAPYAEEEVPQVMTEDLIVVVVEIEKEEAIGMVLVAVVEDNGYTLDMDNNRVNYAWKMKIEMVKRCVCWIHNWWPLILQRQWLGIWLILNRCITTLRDSTRRSLHRLSINLRI